MNLIHISISRGRIFGKEKFETILTYGAAGEYEILEQVGKRYWFKGHLPRYQISKSDWKQRRDELLAVVPSDMRQQHNGETRWYKEAPISWFAPGGSRMLNEAREEFEKWVRLDEGNWWQLRLELDEQGNYKDNNTHHRWCGWANAWIHLWFKLKED